MSEDLLDFYDRCSDEGCDEDHAYEDPMVRDLTEKECKGCKANVLLRPGEGFCESCASYREMPKG